MNCEGCKHNYHSECSGGLTSRGGCDCETCDEYYSMLESRTEVVPK